MKNILVLCTGNSCRSQIAHGYLDQILINKAKIYSAGIETHGLNPYAVKVMEMDGVNIDNHTSNLVDEYLKIKFDFIITVCDNANETCPIFPGESLVKIHKNFIDPTKIKKGEYGNHFIRTRDEIKRFIQNFIENYLDK